MVDFTGGTWRSLIDGSEVSDIPDRGILHEWDVRELSLSDQDSVSSIPDNVDDNDLSASGDPIYETDVFGGESGINLDGSNDYFDTSLPTYSQPIAVFAVVDLDDDGNRSVITSFQDDLMYHSHRFDSNDDQSYDFRNLNGTNGASGSAQSGKSVMTLIADGTSGSIRRNGDEVTTVDTGDGDISGIYAGVRAGELDRHLNGHIAYYSMYDYSQMNSGQVSDVEDALNNIFGVY